MSSSSQMSALDQKNLLTLPGNTSCSDCGSHSPQWASVSFGNLFCLDCSGVHRSLGVHISFVRSVAMDSWTQKQLDLMFSGGNSKMNEYLSANGIDTSRKGGSNIRSKYDNDVASLYREVVKARAEGRDEPKRLVKVVREAYVPKTFASGSSNNSNGYSSSPSPSSNSSSSSSSNYSNSNSNNKRGDPLGLEKLINPPETDNEYVKRQTELRDAAKKRMSEKFGGASGMSGGRVMGGVGSSGGGGGGRGNGGGRMGGVGSNPSYDPSRGGYSNGGGSNDYLASFGSALTSIGSYTRSTVNDAKITERASSFWSTATEGNASTNLKVGASNFWGGLSKTFGDVAKIITEPDANGEDDDDGLAGMRARALQETSGRGGVGVKYGGFGSESNSGGGGGSGSGSSGSISGGMNSMNINSNSINNSSGYDMSRIDNTSSSSNNNNTSKSSFDGNEWGGNNNETFATLQSTSHSQQQSSRKSPTPSQTSNRASPVQIISSLPSPPPANPTPSKPAKTETSNKIKSADDFFADFGA